MSIRFRLSLAAATMLLASCAAFELEGTGAITPDAMTGSETVHGSLYGFRWRPHTVEKCGQDSLFRVEVQTNVAFLLVSVASLGLYVPQTVEWWCHAIDVSDEEAWDPTAQLLPEPLH